ncbi:glycine cleavage system aminomethyltransferase GcvT [Candidatus Ferrigenium straubiae]|uniref:glycine cleavage system aminomethyltransferase GcvT n=1 Tax=Candidatus Ferrigenium straubiae TaxID=2919506 RepID=UPI003F4AC3C9
MTLKQTPLNEAHRAMGAKMVDFGGWDMPVNYGSQIDEHHQVRNDCGMFDVSHMRVVDIKGKGVRDFLRYLLANNVDKLTTPGKALYSCMLLENGGVIDDLIVYFMEEQWFRIVVNAGTADKDIAWMKKQATEHAKAHPECYAKSEGGAEGEVSAEVAPPEEEVKRIPNAYLFGDMSQEDAAKLIWGEEDEEQTEKPPLDIAEHPELSIIAIQGPNAREKLWTAMPGSQQLTEKLAPFSAIVVGTMFIARTGYTGEDGFEVVLPSIAAPYFWKSLSEKGVEPCGLGARDTLRLEAGMNLYGQDMDENVNPLESGLAWTVDLKSERDFIGKAALLANPPARKLVGLVLQDRGVLRGHQKVHTAHGEGEITSGSFSPTLNQSIALARVPKDVQVGDEVQVAIRDKMLTAKVVKYPFARNGKAVVSG